jgi:2-methylcitrate dehydratase PrpD
MKIATDLSVLFAAVVARARYEDLPPAAIEAAKKSVLDTLGVILAAGGVEPAVRPVLDLVNESGGTPESSLLGFDKKVPAQAAALANGAMAHCLDFDDRTPWGRHCGSSLVPALLALAERQPRVSGRTLIAAIAAGQDLFIRLREHAGADDTWNLSTVLGVLCAAAAGSRVLGLDAARTAAAIGIASTQASGTMQVVNAGSQLRGMYAGFSASSAVVAALLAQKGLGGVEGALEGEAGLLTLCFHGKHVRDRMLERLGVEYRGERILYKPWPVVGLSHAYIHATLELMRRHGLAAADIARIHVHVGETQRPLCTPTERRRSPANAMEAKFSLPFCVALAAVHGRIAVSHFTAEALGDGRVRAIAANVVAIDEEGPASRVPGVEVITRDGRTFEQPGRNIPGSPEAPMTWDDLAGKFIDNAGAAAVPMTPAKARGVVQTVAAMDELDDVADIVRSLA